MNGMATKALNQLRMQPASYQNQVSDHLMFLSLLFVPLFGGHKVTDRMAEPNVPEMYATQGIRKFALGLNLDSFVVTRG